jgi:outer membrane biosynthesis protein TonB
MEGASGTVEVEFSVDAAGGSAVRSATGPDVLRPAAEHMVSSWTFRRTTAERLFLLARISFEPEGAAKAEVSLAP